MADFVHSNIASVLEEEMGKTEDMAPVWGATYLTVDSMSHKAGHNTSGCTAVTCLVRRKGDSRYLYTANVGDARAVLARNGRAVRLTQVRGPAVRGRPPSPYPRLTLAQDHKATDDSERERIEAAGGFVMRGRVVGMLAVSRSFGDHGLKQFVTAQPFTTETKLSGRDTFLVCACDGLWDVFEDQEVVDFVADRIAAGRTSGTAQALIQQALARGSMDNISIIVAFF